MSLFGKLFGKTQPSPADADAAMPRFEVAQDQMFDLAKTDELKRLIAMPADERDDRWQNTFFAAYWNAAIVVPSDTPFIGPDNFPYLRVEIPGEGDIDANSLSNIARSCIEAGSGIVLFATAEAMRPAR